MLAGLQNVTFEFGARVLVEDATWHIQPGERIGYNGTGVSTFLKLPDSGYLSLEAKIQAIKSYFLRYFDSFSPKYYFLRKQT